MEPLTLAAFLARAVAWALLGIYPNGRKPTAVESFNAMAAEAGRGRSRQEWALRIGLIVGSLATLMMVFELITYGELRRPANLVYPLAAIAGAA